jgi:hypothetical protein
LGIWSHKLHDPKEFGKTEPQLLVRLKERIQNKAISKAERSDVGKGCLRK